MTGGYLRYLWAQMTQAWAKRAKPPHPIPQAALDIAVPLLSSDSPILCVGARNRQEPEAWRARGYSNIIAVDLIPSPGVRFADMHRLPFADATFQLVQCSHVLEHAWDSGRACREVCRVLRPKGLLWVAWPRGFTPNAHDRIDYDSATAFVTYLNFLSLDVERLWWEDQPTESRALLRIGRVVTPPNLPTGKITVDKSRDRWIR